MKKEYTNPTIELEEIELSDVISTSSYDPSNILDDPNASPWFN